jgi:cobalt transporter subunit CbtB
MMSRSLTQSRVGLSSRQVAGVISALLGAVFLFGVGFAQPQVLHNAAHDGRHAFTFPCH